MWIITIAVLLVSGAGSLLCGAVDIPAEDVWRSLSGGDVAEHLRFIVVQTRVPAIATAILASMALSVAGLLMQTTFNNPLAGPSILGVSTGASLGVAIVLLAAPAVTALSGQSLVMIAAILGASAVIAILVMLSSVIRSSTMLLITGILLGYLSSSIIALLNFFATREGIQAYVLWGLGNFTSVSMGQLPLLAACVTGLSVLSLLCIRPLNTLLLGRRSAELVGLDVALWRTVILGISGALTAVATAWCGPIAFLGLIVPHIGRLGLQTSNHARLLPYTILCGAATGALCRWISVLPAQWGVIPINAITPIIGVPILIYIIIKRKSLTYFN